MAICDRGGLPIAVHVASASPYEPHLVPATLDARFLPDLPWCLIGDRGYDSDGLDDLLMTQYGIEMIAANRRGRAKTQDGRPLRRAKRRWKIERLFAWLHNCRRVVTRWERHIGNYLGMVQLACARILLRAFMRFQTPWSPSRSWAETLDSRAADLIIVERPQHLLRSASASIQHLADGGDDAIPLALLSGELPAPVRSQRVALHPAGLVGRPFAGNPALLFEPMQRWEERARLHAEGPAGQLTNAIGDGYAMERSQLQGTQHEQIERPAQQIGLVASPSA